MSNNTDSGAPSFTSYCEEVQVCLSSFFYVALLTILLIFLLCSRVDDGSVFSISFLKSTAVEGQLGLLRIHYQGHAHILMTQAVPESLDLRLIYHIHVNVHTCIRSMCSY